MPDERQEARVRTLAAAFDRQDREASGDIGARERQGIIGHAATSGCGQDFDTSFIPFRHRRCTTGQTILHGAAACADHHSTDLPPRALGVLRTALNAAVTWRILDHNPAMLVQKPKHERRRGIALTPAQSAALLAQVEGHRLEALYYIALTLGLRQGELVNLRWASIAAQTPAWR
jgi:hypothetical protein